MNLAPATTEDVQSLKRWFPDRESAYLWGGPGLKFPFTDRSFLKGIRWNAMPAYSAHDSDGTLLAFGQYYDKGGRCHLARLAVRPGQRSAGIGTEFIARLLAIGLDDLSAEESSLFVISKNAAAMNCYRKLGFTETAWPPDTEVLEGVTFMVNASN